ncbi:lysophospholipid acyltransferase family protein [Corynebacterium accolens]|uniref:lysophospholipid acyltransferase family protein n=1 Tax=Corynebacterium accolens TaxID=38284 RepID=UPI00019C3DB9|nr:lysophospholipid acyltransferase family protein [Corynebacterium accolens]EEI15336.1 Acyltransferase [Corynebacterium accolens ATCC 49725]MDK4295146.1 lysophospholipid acyltransferase family protein [Corynebacterium accolens]MDK8470534.1 lysophospholipid acyltransferase family protein [Corynebacterium accolens]MDK8499292.1 lysophospholipid acyltransferase family protein [Corynebacterium accolens]MDK8593772.1 lysophospholipid acyltransferase family protein [Corynebacterium accolens]
MNAATNFLYRQITHIGRGLTLAQGLQMRLSGEENIPDDGGAVLVCNHTGYMDFLFGAFIAYRKKRLVRFLAKASIFSAPGVGALLRAMGHVPVDRIDGKESLRKAVELAEAGELVGVFSEGTISRSFEIRSMKTGASRIAFEAGVPVVPQVMFGSQRLWTKGHKKNLGRTKTPVFITALEPYYPTGDPEADTAEIRRRMQEALEGLWEDYEAEFGPMPAGEYWVPARKGGSAPTLEEAEARDAEVETERHRVRRLRDDLVGLKDRVSVSTVELVRNHMASAKDEEGQDEHDGKEPQEKKHIAADTLEWVKTNLNAVVEEATRGLDEGKDKVADVMAQLKTDVAQAQASIAASSKEIWEGSVVEQGLLAAATQSRLIVSRLPHRLKAQFSAIPRVVVAHQSTLNWEDDALTPRLKAALESIYPAAEVLIVVSCDADLDVPQAVWHIQLDEQAEKPLLDKEAMKVTSATAAAGVDCILDDLDAKPSEALVFGNEPGDEGFLNHIPVVALETAPIEVVKDAQAVTYSAERAGMSEVLEAMARLQKD